MLIVSIIVVILLVLAVRSEADGDGSGYPVGNFGIAAEVGPDGGLLSKILYNPSELGPWLEELGNGEFALSVDGIEIKDREFGECEVRRLFPEASVRYSDERLSGMTVKASCLCPIAAGDAFTCSLPAVLVDLDVENSGDIERTVELAFRLSPGLGLEDAHLTHTGPFWFVGSESTSIGFDRAISWQGISGRTQISCRLTIPAGQTGSVRLLVLKYDRNGFYTEKLASIRQLAEYVADNWKVFAEKRDQFIELLPKVGDRQIDEYLRWYLYAGVNFTRMTRSEVLTMGYCELNQRDSYWTSWIHLVMWPDLERKMIEESAQFQREDGKIPTTILPVIERDDDIDINEYFIMRLVRYYEWTYDLEFVRSLWPSVKKAVDFLKSRDIDGDYLPDQGSFWGDWKDVSGVEGRKAAPHFEFLWLAVLKNVKEFAIKLDDKAAADEYAVLLDNASKQVNLPVGEGGLWTGQFYTSLWYDGREDLHVQEDQVVGMLYDVMPRERIRSVFDSLQPNLTPWGYRDTYPYRENFSHEPGDYHNGGVWVFLNFVDALARFHCGYASDGEDIIRKVGYWDLEKWGDFMPHEYLDGNTGEGAGKPIQGWDAACYAAVFFGMLGVRMTGPDSVEIMPRIPSDRSFSTLIPLNSRVLKVSQQSDAGGVNVSVKLESGPAVNVKYGVLTDSDIADSKTVKVGECEFKAVSKKLESGDEMIVSGQS